VVAAVAEAEAAAAVASAAEEASAVEEASVALEELHVSKSASANFLNPVFD
jgi:hypothetical protein